MKKVFINLGARDLLLKWLLSYSGRSDLKKTYFVMSEPKTTQNNLPVRK